MPATPVAFCSVHSSVIMSRTSLPFFAMVSTLRQALPAEGAAAKRAGAANPLLRADSADTGSDMRAAISTQQAGGELELVTTTRRPTRARGRARRTTTTDRR